MCQQALLPHAFAARAFQRRTDPPAPERAVDRQAGDLGEPAAPGERRVPHHLIVGHDHEPDPVEAEQTGVIRIIEIDTVEKCYHLPSDRRLERLPAVVFAHSKTRHMVSIFAGHSPGANNTIVSTAT